MQIGDLVRVKSLIPDELYNDVIYSDNHGNYKGQTGTILKLIGQDKYILSVDETLIFGKDMLSLETPTGGIDTTSPHFAEAFPKYEEARKISTALLGEKAPRTFVVEKMQERNDKVGFKIQEKDLYFDLFFDKLSSLLFETYGG